MRHVVTSLARLEAWLLQLRCRTTGGELLWLACAAIALALHARAVVFAVMFPERADFVVLIDSAADWIDGVHYSPDNMNPNVPILNLLYLPFVGIPLRVASTTWLLASYAAAAVCLTMTVRASGAHVSRRLAAAGTLLLLAAPATNDHLANGNMIWMLWLIVTAAWVAALKGRHRLSAAFMGLLIVLKPIFGLWLVYYVVKRDWEGLATATSAIGVVFGASLVVFGTEAWLAWGEAVQRVTWFDWEDNASIAGILSRATAMSTPLWLIGVIVSSGVTVWMIQRRPGPLSREWVLMFLLSVLASPLGWRYYCTFAIGPILDWLSKTRLSYAQGLALLGLAVSPALDSTGDPWWTRVTIGSLPFWVVLAAWLAVGFGEPARPRLVERASSAS